MVKVGAKKSLGQYWLKSGAVRATIIRAAALTGADTVLEVGPGRGFLTEALIKQAGRVVAVEKDSRLIEVLQQKFAPEIKSGRLTLIAGDILKVQNKKLKAENYKVVANIPYYITGRVLRYFLTAQHQPILMVLMLQKEVARRIVARGGKEGLLSISLKAYSEPEYVKTVPARFFRPAPKVDSAIIRLKNISLRRLAGIDEKEFFDLLRRGFGQKRKMLKNVLKLSSKILPGCKINEKARAEELALADWLCLTRKLKNE